MEEGIVRIQIAGSLVLAVALAGCVSAPLSELQESTRKGSAVSQALADEYVRFAAVEVTEMVDLKDGDYFAVKGLQAARGGEPAPEAVSDWQLTEAEVSRMQEARNRLAAALANRRDGAVPKTAAAAQVGYDCWIEQQEEDFQPRDIETCRIQYVASVEELEKRKDYPHSVFFGLDEARLTPEAISRIEHLAGKALHLDVPRITVLGHSDRTGGEQHNLTLSLRRADAVERVLVAAGVAPDRVGVAAAGESRSRIATDDGIAEARNRRVEVLFQPVMGW
jgi:OOP family OmpA-OmpF porin